MNICSAHLFAALSMLSSIAIVELRVQEENEKKRQVMIFKLFGHSDMQCTFIYFSDCSVEIYGCFIFDIVTERACRNFLCKIFQNDLGAYFVRQNRFVSVQEESIICQCARRKYYLPVYKKRVLFVSVQEESIIYQRTKREYYIFTDNRVTCCSRTWKRARRCMI